MVDSCGIIEPVSAKTQMLRNLKRLLLGITLIVFASAALLLSDLKQRSETNRSVPRIGLLQTASVQLLDDTVRVPEDAVAGPVAAAEDERAAPGPLTVSGDLVLEQVVR